MPIPNIPKAELHVHLEFTAPPSLIQTIATRNKVSLDPTLFASPDTFAWNGFLNFLETHRKLSHAIKVPQDYYDITYHYLKKCAEEGVIYVEMQYSPEHAEEATGIPSHEHVIAIQQAIDDAERVLDIVGRILMVGVRHYGADSVMKVAREALKETSPCIVGFHLAGDEINYPPLLFKSAFEEAHAGGLGCAVHAGEWQGPAGIRDALELPITRIGHGVRAIEDPTLLQVIKDRGITLEVCPASNIVLGLYKDYTEHPLCKFIEFGIPVTLNSDDPPYFNTSVGREYEIAQQIFGLSEKALIKITEQAIHAAFIDPSTREKLLARVHAHPSMFHTQ